MPEDLLIWLTLGTGALLVLVVILGPPAQYQYRRVAEDLEDWIAGYQGHWLWRTSVSASQRRQRDSERAFSRWFNSRFETAPGDRDLDEELIAAQRLTPIIRQLLEDELPTTIRRCNAVHRRIAILTRAAHMREIAAEEEPAALRNWTVLLLQRANGILGQYPLSLRIDTEELLDTSIAVRKFLLPCCGACPYIRKTVSEAGVQCPASHLIGLGKP